MILSTQLNDSNCAPCQNCRRQFLTSHFHSVSKRFPRLVRICRECATGILRRARERQLRKVALTTDDWTALRAAGFNDATRGLRNLVDTYRHWDTTSTTDIDPDTGTPVTRITAHPFTIPPRFWLDDTAPSWDYANRARRRALRIDDDRYGWLTHTSKTRSPRRARAPIAWPDIVPAIHALVCCYDADISGYAQAVNALSADRARLEAAAKQYNDEEDFE